MAAHRRQVLKRSLTAVAGAVLLGAGLALAPAASAETLIDAMAAAYQNNPRLEAQRRQLRATDEQIAQANSNWRPTVNGRISVGQSTSSTTTTGRNFLNRGTTRSGSVLTPYTYQLEINQPIFRGGQSFAEYHQAMSNIRAARAQLIQVEQEVLLDVVRAYMDVFRDMAVLELRQNNVRVLRRQLQATRDRFSVGEVTPTDVAQARARLSRAEADFISARGTLNSSRARYQNVVGEHPGELEPHTPTVEAPDNADTVREEARRNNPAVVAAGFFERVAWYESRRILGEMMPQLSIQGLLSYNLYSSPTTRRNESASVTAQLTIPLYQAGATTSRLRASRQTILQRRDELAQAQRDAIQVATQAWETLLTTQSQIDAFESEVRANRIALDGVRQEARAGLRTVLDVLDAEQELLDSQVNLVSAQRDLVVAVYEVQAAMGQMTAVNLDLPVETFNERAYFRSIRYLPWGLGPHVGNRPEND